MDLRRLESNRDTIWTLFMMAGYLTITRESIDLIDKVDLRITNYEIRKNLEKICINWFRNNVRGYGDIEYALLCNNMEKF